MWHVSSCQLKIIAAVGHERRQSSNCSSCSSAHVRFRCRPSTPHACTAAANYGATICNGSGKGMTQQLCSIWRVCQSCSSTSMQQQTIPIGRSCRSCGDRHGWRLITELLSDT